MRFIKEKLVELGRRIGRWYDRHIRVEPGTLVWPTPSRVRPVRARSRPHRAP